MWCTGSVLYHNVNDAQVITFNLPSNTLDCPVYEHVHICTLNHAHPLCSAWQVAQAPSLSSLVLNIVTSEDIELIVKSIHQNNHYSLNVKLSQHSANGDFISLEESSGWYHLAWRSISDYFVTGNLMGCHNKSQCVELQIVMNEWRAMEKNLLYMWSSTLSFSCIYTCENTHSIDIAKCM